MTWQVVLGANLVVAVAYFAIFWVIARGLMRSHQFGRANPLGTMTAAIFFSCGVGHYLHAQHLMEPWLGVGGAVGWAARESVDWHMAVWDTVTAFVAVGYLSLRKSYGNLLLRPEMFEDVERQRAAKELAAAEQLFRTAFEDAPIGIALVGLDGRFLQVNEALCELLARPADVLLEQTFQEVTHPDDLDADLQLLGALNAGDIPRYQLEKRYLRPDGTDVPALLSVSLVRDADGVPDYYVSQIKDNTEHKRAQQSADRYREQLDVAQEIAGLGSFTYDPARGESTWSPGLHLVLGTDASSEVARDRTLFGTLVHAADRERVGAAIGRTLAGATPFEERFRIVRPDGELRTVRGQGRMIGATATRGGRLYGVVQDLTDRVALQVARDEAEVRFATVFESAPIGVCLTTLGGEVPGAIVQANAALVRLTGRDAAELEACRLPALLHAEDREAVDAALERLAAGAPHVQLEVRVRRADGAEAWTLLSGAPVTPVSGPPTHAVTQLLDISDRKTFEGQLRHMADHDALTGLFNRRRFDVEVAGALAHADRYGSRGAVLLLDLDGFKFVNDSFGHSAGDELIARVATVLREELRSTDVLARIGGDEFAVLLAMADEHEAAQVAAKLLEAIRTRVRTAGAGRPARISASIGVTCFPPDTEPAGSTDVVRSEPPEHYSRSIAKLTAEDLIAEADIAMYDAKDAGRAGVRIFRASERHRERVTVRARWITRLREALEHDRFRLLAQPIVGICSNGVERAELLLRYLDDDGTLVAPAHFLYLAERYDLMKDIDRWVLGQAIVTLHQQHALGRDVALSVNVSGRTLVDPDIGDELAALLAAHPIPHGRLIIEVTETAAITNIERARVFADRVHELGCRFSLDDFGSGFASFYYLKHLQFDEIKIDGEFVRHLPDTPVDQLVIEAVVGIARGLGTRTVAEFVSSDETLAILRRLGVDYGQGLHLAKPVPLEELLPAQLPTSAKK